MRYLVLILLILPLPLLAEDFAAPDLVFFESGVVCGQEVVGQNPAPGTIAGSTNIIEGEPDFISLNNRVPAVLGIGFGVKAQTAAPLGLSNVQITVTHPPVGANGQTVETYPSAIAGDDPSFSFFQFDFDYELVPGPWVIEASKFGRTLYRAEFMVLPPDQVPELASVCGFEDMLS